MLTWSTTHNRPASARNQASSGGAFFTASGGRGVARANHVSPEQRSKERQEMLHQRRAFRSSRHKPLPAESLPNHETHTLPTKSQNPRAHAMALDLVDLRSRLGNMQQYQYSPPATCSSCTASRNASVPTRHVGTPGHATPRVPRSTHAANALMHTQATPAYGIVQVPAGCDMQIVFKYGYYKWLPPKWFVPYMEHYKQSEAAKAFNESIKCIFELEKSEINSF